MDPVLPSWMTSLLKAPLAAIGKAFSGFRSRRRIKQRLQSASRETRLALNGTYTAASESDDRLFSWTTAGGGLNPAEVFLPFLIDEEALIPGREEPSRENQRTTWYRLKPWLFDYLTAHPELLGESSKSSPAP